MCLKEKEAQNGFIQTELLKISFLWTQKKEKENFNALNKWNGVLFDVS